MQLHTLFHKTVNRNKLTLWKFQSHRLSSFTAINKTVTVNGRGGCKFFLFISLFLSVHLYFQNNLNCCKSLFMIIDNLFSSIALLMFSYLQVNCFFPLFPFLHLINMNKRVLSLEVPSFVFHFNSRKKKQTLIVFEP